jgi:hypothetical protein
VFLEKLENSKFWRFGNFFVGDFNDDVPHVSDVTCVDDVEPHVS